MNWINIHTETLRGEEFIGAEPLERATWLNLLGWCCAQENDGIIRDCKSWGNRKWQQLCGITKDEVDLSSDLYRFEGSNLVITFYPIEQQAAVKAKREAGKKGGRPRKTQIVGHIQNKGEKPHGYDMDNHKDKDTLNVKERKGKESKGKVIVKKTPQPPRGEWEPDTFQTTINACYKRRQSTKWADAEIRAYKKIDQHPEDLALMVRYCNPETGSKFRRRDIKTLLNNWQGELDRARVWETTTNGATKTFQSGHIEIAGRKGYIVTRAEIEEFYGDKDELPLQQNQ